MEQNAQNANTFVPALNHIHGGKYFNQLYFINLYDYIVKPQTRFNFELLGFMANF